MPWQSGKVVEQAIEKANTLIEALGWRAVFLINIPIVAVSAFMTLRFLEESVDPEAERRIDPAGIALLTLGLLMMMLGLIQADVWGWGSPLTLGLLLGSAVPLGAFLVVEVLGEEVGEGLQQLDVVVAVGIEIRLGEIEPEFVAQTIDGVDLADTETHLTVQLPGKIASINLEMRALQVLDLQVRQGRLDLVGRGRRNDGDRVASRLVRLNECPGLGIYLSRNLLFKK